MGKASRDKGARTERAVVKLLQDAGRAAERVPLSGAAGGRYSGDVSVPVFGEDWTVEVKCRGEGFKQIYDWLGTNQALIVKADRRPALVVMDLKRAAELLAKIEALQVPDSRASVKKRAA